MYAKDFFKKLAAPIIWGNLLAMVLVVVALCIGVWFWLDSYTKNGEEIVLPDLTGMNYEAAAERLRQDGIGIAIVDSGYNKSMPAGCILIQQPEGGLKVKQDRTVYITINALHSPRLLIPDLIDNSSYREAKARLQAVGFRLLDPLHVDGEKDWVYGIKCDGRSLAVGDLVSIESPLTLVIGNGLLGDEPEEEYDNDSTMANDIDDFLEINDASLND